MDDESTNDSIETIVNRHKKERKELISKIGNIKHSIPKGDKKRKKEIAAEIANLEAILNDKHENELRAFKDKNHENDNLVNGVTNDLNNVTLDNEDNDLSHNNSNDISMKCDKISKAQRKRDAKALKEREKQKRIESEELNNIDHVRVIENQQMQAILKERRFVLHEVPSDGDCMYKSIEHQLSLRGINTTITDLREKTASYMRDHRDEHLPFLSSPTTGEMMSVEEYDAYCEEIAKTKSWGGEHELRALSNLFKTSIEVIQAKGPKIVIGGYEYEHSEPLFLSYHRHAYQMGEHYNSLLKDFSDT